MSVLAYITDLAFQAKVSQSAHKADVEVQIVSSLYHFLPGLGKQTSMVLIDLNAQGINPSMLIAQVKTKSPDLTVVAYASHLDEELLKQARKAGADTVLEGSELSKDLPQILTQYGWERSTSHPD
jgi:DNA-binding NarL/FixJ family response regulator